MRIGIPIPKMLGYGSYESAVQKLFELLENLLLIAQITLLDGEPECDLLQHNVLMLHYFGPASDRWRLRSDLGSASNS
jgi:hypothetical protein